MAARAHVDAHALDEHLEFGGAITGHGGIIPRMASPGSSRRSPGAPQRPAGGGGGGGGGACAGAVAGGRARAPAPRRRTPPRRDRNGIAITMPARTRRCAPRTRSRVRLGAEPQGHETVDQLQQEPEAQHDDRRHGYQLVEEDQEHQRLDSRPGEQHEVRAQHGGDRPRRPDHRDLARRIHEDVPGGGRDPADQEECREQRAPEPVLHVHGEDPQEQHVAHQVQPAAVQEHVRRTGRSVGARQVVARAQRSHQVRRHQPAPLEEPGERGIAALGEQHQLPPEHEAAQGQDRRRHQRGPAGGPCVAKRQHLVRSGARGRHGLGVFLGLGSWPASRSGRAWRSGRASAWRPGPRRASTRRCGARCWRSTRPSRGLRRRPRAARPCP